METTTEQRERFEGNVRRAWYAAGITGWDLVFLSDKLEAVAECRSDILARRCVFVLSTEIDEEDAKLLDRIAIHEVCHALLAPLAVISDSRYTTKDEQLAAEHEVVMRLIPLIAERLEQSQHP